MNISTRQNDGLYEFRGKTFPCDRLTIQQFNLALSLNGSEERYRLTLGEVAHASVRSWVVVAPKMLVPPD